MKQRQGGIWAGLVVFLVLAMPGAAQSADRLTLWLFLVAVDIHYRTDGAAQPSKT